jgi:hypothetical protein
VALGGNPRKRLTRSMIAQGIVARGERSLPLLA